MKEVAYFCVIGALLLVSWSASAEQVVSVIVVLLISCVAGTPSDATEKLPAAEVHRLLAASHNCWSI